MSDAFEDEIWPHFAPLWTDLRGVSPGLLLAGGYGLFLKQRWLQSKVKFLATEKGQLLVTETGARLIAEDGIKSLVGISDWLDQNPRVTKDMDFIVELNIIASPTDQQKLHNVLEAHIFKVVVGNARWQFEKHLDAHRRVVLDFLSPSPAGSRNDLRVEAPRVKPKPSLKNVGIHGRETTEAVGCSLHPFSFVFNDLEITIPNAVTLTIMKLAAMRDQWQISQTSAETPDQRRKADFDARKHAIDVCRVLAMMTREENDQAKNVLNAIRTTPVFTDAVQIYKEFFERDEGWGTRVIVGNWQTRDFQSIRSVLAAWLC